MKKYILTLLLALSCVSFSIAEEVNDTTKRWKIGGNTSFTFNQISFHNWAAGGKNSMAGTFLFKTFANYKSKKVTWDNTLDLGYGLTKYKDEDYQKSEDKMNLSSLFGYDAYKAKWYYSALLDFKSQFAKGYKYSNNDTTLVSKAFSPAYINISIGMQYKPNDVFSFYLSPLTGRMTIVADTLLATGYGLDAGEKVRAEYGAYAKLLINKSNLLKNVDYYLRADFFSNLCESPEHIDCDIETGFNFRVNEYLTALIKFNLLFDDDIKHKESYVDENGDKQTRERGARLQCKELFGFGLAFKF